MSKRGRSKKGAGDPFFWAVILLGLSMIFAPLFAPQSVAWHGFDCAVTLHVYSSVPPESESRIPYYVKDATINIMPATELGDQPKNVWGGYPPTDTDKYGLMTFYTDPYPYFWTCDYGSQHFEGYVLPIPEEVVWISIFMAEGEIVYDPIEGDYNETGEEDPTPPPPEPEYTTLIVDTEPVKGQVVVTNFGDGQEVARGIAPVTASQEGVWTAYITFFGVDGYVTPSPYQYQLEDNTRLVFTYEPESAPPDPDEPSSDLTVKTQPVTGRVSIYKTTVFGKEKLAYGDAPITAEMTGTWNYRVELGNVDGYITPDPYVGTISEDTSLMFTYHEEDAPPPVPEEVSVSVYTNIPAPVTIKNMAGGIVVASGTASSDNPVTATEQGQWAYLVEFGDVDGYVSPNSDGGLAVTDITLSYTYAETQPDPDPEPQEVSLTVAVLGSDGNHVVGAEITILKDSVLPWQREKLAEGPSPQFATVIGGWDYIVRFNRVDGYTEPAEKKGTVTSDTTLDFVYALDEVIEEPPEEEEPPVDEDEPDIILIEDDEDQMDDVATTRTQDETFHHLDQKMRSGMSNPIMLLFQILGVVVIFFGVVYLGTSFTKK